MPQRQALGRRLDSGPDTPDVFRMDQRHERLGILGDRRGRKPRQIQQLRAFSDDYIAEARRLANKLMEDPDLEKPDFYEGHGNSDPAS